MEDEKTDYVSNAIIDEIQHDEKLDTFLTEIRHGNAGYISQEAWDIVADFLELKLYARRKIKEKDLVVRNIQIGKKFLEMKDGNVPDKIAFSDLAKKYGESEATIKAIATKTRKAYKIRMGETIKSLKT